MSLLPTAADPDLPAFSPAGRRSLTVFGAPVELVCLPDRRKRGNRVTPERPAFGPSPARRIQAEECLWQDDEFVVTPNKYPSAREHRLVWPRTPRREPDARLWSAAAAWCAATGGTALANNVGAAATIAWAHVHLTPERLDFLPQLPERAPRSPLPTLPREVEVVVKDVPCALVGLRGNDFDALGQALAELAMGRLVAANNVCIVDGTAWSFPRRTETPAPHFPYALGASEVWGRWCYLEEPPFHAADGAQLEAALTLAGTAAL